MKLTAAAVEKLRHDPARGGQQEVSDDLTRGLYLRLYATRKSYIFRYKFRGRRRIIVLGEAARLHEKEAERQQTGRLSLAEARLKAEAARHRVVQGFDPAADEQRLRADRLRMPTAAEFVQEYVAHYARPNKRSWREDEAMLARWVTPRIGRLPLDEVHRRDVQAILDEIRAAGHVRQPGKVLAVVRRMFRFAVERGVLEESPVVYLSVPQPDAQTSALTAEQIVTLWRATHDPAVSNLPTRLALRLGLLTGQRPGEVGGCRVEELDLEAREWRIPGERRKRGRPGTVHVVPLGEAALVVVRQALADCAENGFLFPNARGNGGVRPDGTLNTTLKTLFADEGGRAPTPHTLRATVATELSDELDFPEEVVARVLGHYPRSVTQQYIKRGTNRARRALEAWEVRLLSLVAGECAAAEAIRPEAEN